MRAMSPTEHKTLRSLPSDFLSVICRYAWVKGEVGHDKIGQAHFRNILQFEASQLGVAVPGGQPYVTVTVKGASFMVNHFPKPGLSSSVAQESLDGYRAVVALANNP